MDETRGPGMDHRLYPFSALPERPKLAWPGGARVALVVTLYLEHWEFVAPKEAVRDPRFVGEFGSFKPDYRSFTQREAAELAKFTERFFRWAQEIVGP